MNTNLLAIGNIFAGTSGIGTDPAKPAAIRKSKQFSIPTPDNAPFNKARGTETVDNTLVNPHNGHKNVPRSEFGPTPDTKVPQKSENSGKATKQNLTQIPAEQPSIVQLWLAQYSLNVEHGKEGVARKVEPKAGYELAQLLTNLKPDKFPSVTGNTKTNQPVLIVHKKQIGLEATLPKTSEQTLITEIHTNEGENADRIQMPNTRPLATKVLNSEKSGEGFTLQPLIRAHHRITTADGKPEDVPVSNAFGSQQTSALTGEGLKPQVLVNAANEITNVIQKPAIARKPDVVDLQKIPLSNPNIPPVQDKSSGLQFQAVRIESETSPLIAENAVADKTAVSQPILTRTQQFSGPLGEDVAEQGPNSPGNLAYQHLHRAQLQISAGPIKGRDGSVSNNSNTESGFEQILSGSNATAYIEEQISAFPEAVKTDNLPTQNSPNDVSASITEQILEFINNPSSQHAGAQQVTIRLNPPELGEVFIKFEEQENQITGLLEVSKAQTRYEVEQALPHIIQNLADSGIQVRRLEVMLADQYEQQSYRDESLQDGSFQQYHDFSERGNPGNQDIVAANESDIFGRDGSYWYNLEPQMQITDNSINILI